MQESVFFFSEGYRLEADLYLPDDLATGETRPGIVLCNGYTAGRDLYLPETARALNESGYVALAFDFKGWGDSEGPRHRLAPHGRVMDAQCALTFLGLRPEVDEDRLGLLGWSYGGATAIWVAAVDERAKCVVSVTGVGDGGRWMRSVRQDGEWEELLARSVADRNSRVVSGTSRLAPRPEILKLDPESDRVSALARRSSKGAVEDIPLEFVDETLAFNPEWVVERISPRSVLFITGDGDRIVPPEESRILYERAKSPKKLVVLENCAHYDIYTGEPFKKILDEAAAWYRQHLSIG